MRKRGSAAEWGRLRVAAANMLDDGPEPARVGRLLGVGAQTVRAWRRAYAAAGRPPGLTEDQKGRLGSMLSSGRAEQGSPAGPCGPSGRSPT